jgi:hypothetical protein
VVDTAQERSGSDPNDDHGEAALRRLLDGVVSLSDLDASWLRIATDLLRFSADHVPDAMSWEGLPPSEPHATVVTISALARLELAKISPGVFENLADDETSFATHAEREALRTVGLSQLVDPELGPAMNIAATALGLAEAIDGLAGATFMTWMRGKGEWPVVEGDVYPTREHDPRAWLGNNQPNTRRSNLPTRDLASTSRLRVATSNMRPFKYVLDFQSWSLLSDLGIPDGLVAAVGQPNIDLDDFSVELDASSYANHGPKDDERQKASIVELITKSGLENADVLVLPEYSLSTGSRDLLIESVPQITQRPRLVVVGVSAGLDDGGYIINEAVMIVSRSQADVPHIITLPNKMHPAEVGALKERIRQHSEIRIFLSEKCTIAVLICYDSMNAEVLRQLAAFGVNILLVPALSPKTASMIDAASSLSHLSQAFVVVATGPSRWSSTTLGLAGDAEARAEAGFAGPYAVAPTVEFFSSAAGAGARTELWVFSYPRREGGAY